MMKRITRSSSQAGSNASPRPPLLLEDLFSSAFPLSALMLLLEPEDKRSLRLSCRALRQAIDPLLHSITVPADPTPVEARAARRRWPIIRSVTASSLKQLALLADGGALGAAFPQLQVLALNLPTCSNLHLASIARSVCSCPLLACLKLHLLQPGCLPALAPLTGCGTLRTLHLSLTGRRWSHHEGSWQPLGLQVLSSLTQLQDIRLHFVHAPRSRQLTEMYEALDLAGVLEGLTALQQLEVGEDFTLGEGSFAALAGCSRLQRLSWSGCNDDALHHLAAAAPHLQRLDVDSCEGFRSLTGLEQLTSLQRLSLTSCCSLQLVRGVPSSDVPSPLAALTQLTYLDLSATWGVCHLDCLAGLTGLTHLDVSETSVTDIGCLSGLTRLTYLDVSDTSVRSLEALRELTALLHFDAGCCAGIRDISPLRCCSRLQHLGLEDALTRGEEQLFAAAGGGEVLLALPHLRFLDISRTRLPELGPLSRLTQLQELRMVEMGAPQPHTDSEDYEDSDSEHEEPEPEPAELDLSPLSRLTGLTALDLSLCRLCTPPGFTPLLGLSRLRLLRCEGREAEAKACLSSLVKLQVAGFDYDN